MKQISLDSNPFEVATKRTRKREFLDEMNRVVPWSELVMLIFSLPPSRKHLAFYKTPLVDGTTPPMRASISTAMRKARPKALKTVSHW